MQVKGAIEIIELDFLHCKVKGYPESSNSQVTRIILSEEEARKLWRQIGLKLRDIEKDVKP
jgi:predicted oxidoreductase (fatty acid repression mutant protein)